MMRRWFFASVIAATVAVGGTASAQQRPTPLPTNTGNTGTDSTAHRSLPLLRFPAPASAYEQYIQYYLKLLRDVASKYRVAPGDMNKVVLYLKDCAARVEADGYVTRPEAEYCKTTTMTMVHETATPYMMQAAGDGN